MENVSDVRCKLILADIRATSVEPEQSQELAAGGSAGRQSARPQPQEHRAPSTRAGPGTDRPIHACGHRESARGGKRVGGKVSHHNVR